MSAITNKRLLVISYFFMSAITNKIARRAEFRARVDDCTCRLRLWVTRAGCAPQKEHPLYASIAAVLETEIATLFDDVIKLRDEIRAFEAAHGKDDDLGELLDGMLKI